MSHRKQFNTFKYVWWSHRHMFESMMENQLGHYDLQSFNTYCINFRTHITNIFTDNNHWMDPDMFHEMRNEWSNTNYLQLLLTFSILWDNEHLIAAVMTVFAADLMLQNDTTQKEIEESSAAHSTVSPTLRYNDVS